MIRRMIALVKGKFHIVWISIYNRVICKQSNALTFIPHGGCDLDGNNFINYRSDSALTFFNYIVSRYGDKYTYNICVGDKELKFLEIESKKRFPDISIRFFYYNKVKTSLLNKHAFYKAISRSKYIFTSEICPLTWKTQEQRVYYLGYYSCSFKNDLVPHYLDNKNNNNRIYDALMASSELFAYINSPVYKVPVQKFTIQGMTRDDNLLLPVDLSHLNNWIEKQVDYQVTKVFLYTPTHRDYEQNKIFERPVLGFEVSKDRIEAFLKKNNAIIICKIHSHQNYKTLAKTLPKGIVLHETNYNYGLCELLKRADYLITDYTSTYFDYLLLNRPVLFNFYDYDIYKKTRGFAFDPLDSILAGEIFTDEESFFEKMELILHEDKFENKRRFVCDLVHKYKDSNNSERTYDYIFND